MLFNIELFDIIYKEGEKFNYDIIGFKAVQANNYYAKITEMEDGCHMHNYNFIIIQPELSLFGISKKGQLNITEVHIWSKCIRNSIYKRAINSLGRKRYFLYMSWAEDTSMVFILFNIAESYRYITINGIFRYNRINSASYSMADSHKLFGEIFFLDVIFDFTKNTFEYKKFVVNKAIQIRNSRYFNYLNKLNINKKIF